MFARSGRLDTVRSRSGSKDVNGSMQFHDPALCSRSGHLTAPAGEVGPSKTRARQEIRRGGSRPWGT